VLIDSPPLASVTDALLLARYADIVLFVVQHNRVDKKLIKRTVASLRKVTPNLLGGILNAVDVKSRNAPYSYYYAPHEEVTPPPAADPPPPESEEAEPQVVAAAKFGTKRR
jgi:Mrp family chromosome partitioning ATPase